LHRIARMLAAGRSAVLEGLGVDMVLWRIWDAAGVAKTWQHKALTPGPGAARADADLDAAVALFTVAEQFVDRRSGASPRAFIDHLAGQDFPADTLAARADRTDAVALHTAASAAGEHWPVVVVAGVQEDTWPDLRLRDTLLGAATLADLATSRHRAGAHNYVHARQEVLHDELRMFLSACSRARRHLIVTAVLDADARPSLFFDRLAVQTPPLTRVDPPLDLRGLVGTLRAHLTPEPGDHAAERAEATSSLLATLAENDVVGADAQCGYARLPGSGRLLLERGTLVVNSSTIERALTCTLQWFLISHGGRAAERDAQTHGTIIHVIAKNQPRGTEADLRRELDER